MNAHIPTLFLMLIVINITLTLSVGLAARAKLRDGMAFWTAGLACNAAGYVLYMLRGQISDVFTIVLANAFFASVFALFTEGVFQFQKRKPRRWLIWSPVLVTVVLSAALISSQLARMVVASLVFSGQCIAVVISLLQRRKATVGVGQYFMVAGFSTMAVAFTVLAVGTLQRTDQVTSIITPHPVQTLFFLVAAISVLVVSMGLVVMNKERADERNHNLAMRDELTGLINRRSLLESLTQHLSTAKRHGQPLSVLMIDIDLFKRVNDTHGHLSGDKVLKAMASAIAQRIRAQDLLGRLGGEEFLVILPNTSVEGAWQLAETLRQCVAATAFETVSGQPVVISVSIGLCALRQLSDPQCDDLIAAVDQALYRAKAAGRNRVEVYFGEPKA